MGGADNMNMKKTLALILAILLIFACPACVQVSPDSSQSVSGGGITGQAEDPVTDLGGLEVIVFTTAGISSADAILLRTENHNIMIDTSSKKGFGAVREYLAGHYVTAIDCLVLTHFDKDHIGGAAGLFDIVEVSQVIMPGYQKQSKTYDRMTDAMNACSLEPLILTETLTITFDGAIFTFYPPERDFYGEDEDNDFSIITSVTHGGNSFLFMGDAEGQRTREYLENADISHQFLKAPHHGKFEEEYAELFERVNPAYAVITDGDGDPADNRTLELLSTTGAEIYLTSGGTVMIKSDGYEIIPF